MVKGLEFRRAQRSANESAMRALRGEPETGEGRRMPETHSGEGMLKNSRVSSTQLTVILFNVTHEGG